MTTSQKENVFDQVLTANNFGGRYAHEIEPNESLRSFFDVFINGIPNEMAKFGGNTECIRPLSEVFAGIAPCTKLNACAFRSGDIYYVGVCRGVFVILAEAFQRLLSMPSVFPWIGDVSRETPERISATLPRDSSLLLPDQRVLPVDRMRYLASAFMMVTALDFLVKHEIRHLVRGHVDYARNHLRADRARGKGSTAERGQPAERGQKPKSGIGS